MEKEASAVSDVCSVNTSIVLLWFFSLPFDNALFFSSFALLSPSKPSIFVSLLTIKTT